MSRATDMEVKHTYYSAGNNHQDMVMVIDYIVDGVSKSTKRHVIRTSSPNFQKTMIGMGWVPPLATARPLRDENEIDRVCARIAGSEPTSPMISYAGQGMLRVGGQINLEQAIAIVAMLCQVKK